MASTILELVNCRPLRGENQLLRFRIKGYVGSIQMNIPFATREEAKVFATERSWILRGYNGVES